MIHWEWLYYPVGSISMNFKYFSDLMKTSILRLYQNSYFHLNITQFSFWFKDLIDTLLFKMAVIVDTKFLCVRSSPFLSHV